MAERPRLRWLNATVLGVGLASLFSDWSHEIATAAMPAFLASLGISAVWLGIIEGLSDGLASFAKMASGFYTDKLPRRKPIAVLGYLGTALGMGSLALATNAWHILLARGGGWFCRGVRTPVRKALLAGAVTKDAYGRAFGLERAMDTVGAILGPLSALFILQFTNHNFRVLFAWTLVPGVLAAAVILFLVRERERKPVAHISFGERLRLLPSHYRRFVAAVGLFGAGDFSPTLLILLATQRLTPSLGLARATSIGVLLYVFRNIFYAAFSLVAGWLGDRFAKNHLLAIGYALAGIMALMVIVLPVSVWTLGLIFLIGGIYAAMEETLEDSLCAELVDESHHGMAFGVLATVNGVGDSLSSIVVGALWSAFGTTIAFSYSVVLFFAGAILVARLPAHRAV
ncbi:MAG: MFS transporter [Verrucomicrobiota bacterium]|nr:MFS transporter [Verrucomicrobiota bacterium]